MKLVAVFCFVFICFVVSCHGLPIEQEDVHVVEESNQGLLRVKRFTCDVLSFEAKGFKLNDAACAAHCLTRGKRGGWCDKHRVCNCRK